ncbi:MAG: Cys-tRNA(Pro) deacylase [Clostridiales Family XIII bacterium]|jgi:Cys-tRNA(Pro)/Cys-tRNA(Cys) deacylase|nr:Cys-tRNA(Pro) deacylase [Clostridiales Family XIII bacterium]
MKKKADVNKTNAARMLDAAGIPYALTEYADDGAFHSGADVAAMVGADPARVFKTLVCRGHSGAYCVFVVPVTGELDLKRAAAAAGEKKVEMIPAKDITPVTGYVKGGCSPVGMKKAFATFIDSSAAGREAIFCSAGKRGLQLEIAPEDLAKAVSARFADLTGAG